MNKNRPNWPDILAYAYRMLIMGGSGSWKTNA